MKLGKALHPSFIKRLHHMRFLGTVALEEQKTKKNSFFIRCLSPVPNVIAALYGEEPIIFEGVCNNKKNEPFFTKGKESGLSGKLVLFRLRYCDGSLSVEIIRTEKRKIANFYHIIPSPKMSIVQTRESFERKLGKGYVSFLMPKFPHDFGMPDLLWYEGRLYGNLSLKSSISAIAYREQKREVKYIEIDNWSKCIEVNVDSSLYFVAADMYEQLKKRVSETGEDIEVVEVNEQGKEIEWNEREYTFLQYMKQVTSEKGLYIDESDIYNFHTCVKTNMLTIVGGIPGIGKSKFVQSYGKALGLTFGKELVWIPISPSYQEPHDVLGYLHPSGTYMESETNLTRTLLAAAENPNQLYMIVFDEMNMSHIEHWFTPFLSLLQLDRKERILSLYNGDGKKDQHIPPQIEIGDNVIFIGTVNFDETTKELSDRLLDRTNVITMRKIPFCEMNMSQEKVLLLPFAFSVSTVEFRGNWFKQKKMLEVFSEEELELLDKLHQLLSSCNASKGVSFRVATAIASYLQNIPRLEDYTCVLSREEAFDVQVKQRILTKLRGTEAMIGPLLREEGRSELSLAGLLQSPLANSVSAFEQSLLYLKQKRQELELYGYVK